MPGANFSILIVCTANICRSPIIERTLRHELRNRLGDDAARFDVSSAGTWEHEPSPMHGFASQVLTEHGIDPSGFVSRPLAADMVGPADLVLAATREHRATVVTLQPRAVRRTFTVLEFGRLLGSVEPMSVTDPILRAHALVEAAAANRGQIPVESPSDDDMPDPIGHPIEDYRVTFKTAAEAIAPFVDRL